MELVRHTVKASAYKRRDRDFPHGQVMPQRIGEQRPEHGVLAEVGAGGNDVRVGAELRRLRVAQRAEDSGDQTLPAVQP